MPSTTSRVVSIPLASSTVTTPSLPTFSMASAMRLPTVASLLAAMVATCAISFLSFVDFDIFWSSWTTFSTARSMPRCSAVGFAPAVTFLRPARKMAWARTVAVVVPSPAISEVLVATSFTIWAPIFSIGSLSSTSLATVTPSLVTVGEPNFLSMTTFRPLGPRVTLTASARASTPRLSLARASVLKSSSFAAICNSPWWGRADLAELREDVGRLDDDVLVAVERVGRAAVLPVDHLVADLEVHRDPGPLLEPAGADRDDLALGGLLLGGIRDVEAAAHRLGLLGRRDDHAVLERLDLEAGLGLGSSRHFCPPQRVIGNGNLCLTEG